MRLLLFGGSNTLWRDGYSTALVSGLEAAGPLEVTNLALGATTCLMGLERLQEYWPDEAPDVVIVEYAVNDYLYMVTGDIELWRAAFEGLLRQISERWPAALKGCVILGREDSKPNLWSRMVDDARVIFAHYPGTLFFDSTDMLPAVQKVTGAPVYENPLHYHPQTQQELGRELARTILDAGSPTVGRLPPPRYQNVLDKVALVDFSNFAPERTRTFENSIIALRCLRLDHNDRLAITVPGPPICVTFVSAPDAGSFRMTSGERTAVIHTLHTNIKDGRLAFMPLSIHGDWWRDPVGPRELVLETVSNTGQEADWPLFHVEASDRDEAAAYPWRCLVRI